MKFSLSILLLALLTGCTSAGLVKLVWTQSDTNGVTGWRVYSVASGVTNVVGTTTNLVTITTPYGAQIFVTATNATDESAPSNFYTNTVPAAPVNLGKQ